MSRSRPITKALFASGLQCAKRLYLDYHQPDGIPEDSTGRQRLAEIGVNLIELARGAFPQNHTADPDDVRAAIAQTSKWLAESPHVAVFDAAFAVEGVEVRTDIAIADGSGGVEIYEVKSGTKVKTRHIRDLAFQVHAIERSGLEVHRAWILHLNTQYQHKGGSKYPILELFRHVDVTDKVKSQAQKIAGQVANFRSVLEDPVTLELPTGTWCHLPFPCGYLQRCRAEGPDLPLIDLPELGRDQESELHQDGIETLADLPADHEDLTPLQRRALRALQSGGPVVESFVGRELRDVEHPLHFVDSTSLLQVLPLLAGSRPWQHIPFLWHDTVVEEDGSTRTESFVADGKSDPRAEFLSSLAETVLGDGTLMVYGPSLEQRLRELLEDLPEQKSEVRALLNQARFDLRQLVKAGIYDPGFGGSFDLSDVDRGLVGGDRMADLEIGSDDEAQAACQRLLNSRTRAATRKKLTAQLDAYGERCSEAIRDVYQSLMRMTEGVVEPVRD